MRTLQCMPGVSLVRVLQHRTITRISATYREIDITADVNQPRVVYMNFWGERACFMQRNKMYEINFRFAVRDVVAFDLDADLDCANTPDWRRADLDCASTRKWRRADLDCASTREWRSLPRRSGLSQMKASPRERFGLIQSIHRVGKSREFCFSFIPVEPRGHGSSSFLYRKSGTVMGLYSEGGNDVGMYSFFQGSKDCPRLYSVFRIFRVVKDACFG